MTHQDHIRAIIKSIGDDPEREGLQETPARVVASWRELFSGYNVDPASVMKVFDDDACDEMVVVKNISFTSFCEHHMLPFVGVAHMAYMPNQKIIGLSKLPRLLEVYTKRLQIQERITEQVTTALDVHLNPLGSACIIEANHLCMSCRGVKQSNATMITSSLTGVFRKIEVRAELFSLLK